MWKRGNCVSMKMSINLTHDYNMVTFLTGQSEVYTWGENSNSTLGHDNMQSRRAPELVEALRKIGMAVKQVGGFQTRSQTVFMLIGLCHLKVCIAGIHRVEDMEETGIYIELLIVFSWMLVFTPWPFRPKGYRVFYLHRQSDIVRQNICMSELNDANRTKCPG